MEEAGDIFFVNVQIGCRRGSGRPPCLELRRIGDGRRGILTEIGNEKKPGVGKVTLGQASGIAESGYIGMNVKVPGISSGILCRLGGFKRDILRAVGSEIGGQGQILPKVELRPLGDPLEILQF